MWLVFVLYISYMFTLCFLWVYDIYGMQFMLIFEALKFSPSIKTLYGKKLYMPKTTLNTIVEKY